MSLTVNTHPRLRAVSTADILRPEDNAIAGLVKGLDTLDCQSYTALQDTLDESTILQQLRHFLKDDGESNSAHSGFRRAGGFQALLRLLRSLVETYTGVEDSSAHVKTLLQSLAQSFSVLGAALEGHEGNQRYFRTRVDNGGWESLQGTLEKVLGILSGQTSDNLHLEQFFGILFASATGVEMISDIYTTLSRPSDAEHETLLSEDTVGPIQASIIKALTNVGELAVPELFTVVLVLWSTGIKAGNIPQRKLRVALPVSLKESLSISRHNIVSAHTAGAFSAILGLIFEQQLSLFERGLFKEVALLLCQEGVSNLDDAESLFRKATTSSDAASFLHDAIEISRQPPSIQFDLSHHGYASTELANLGQPFPPLDTAGYTLSLWARFDAFDPRAHTTLFGAFDRTQTCFILAYLEKDTHHLILQTAIQGTRPSVRFKSVAFEADRWYHICIVHKRPRTTSSPKALLFVDGEFAEQQKSNYPSVPQNDRSQSMKVQAFFGTPQDLSPNSPGASCLSKWSLGSAILFQDVVSDDLISVFYHLGPKYHGNFQDCLGSFQTYEASAALNLRNELLHAGKEEQSELIMAIRHKASNLIREDKLLINVSPATTLDNDDRNNIDETQLVRSLSRLAAKNLIAYTRSGTNAVAINGAVPAINDALTQSRGVFMLMGDPAVAVPNSLDDASWRLGGCGAIGLGLVQRARTTEDVALAVDILLETVRHSWRNSEVMERDGGYAILAMLLKEKLSLPTQNNTDSTKVGWAIPTQNLDRTGLSMRVLASILRFAGYNTENLTKSVINNPLAYKVLVADTSLWRCGPLSVQQLYFDQFSVFADQSEFSRFNMKRLTRMRVQKRLLEALKSEPVSRAIIPQYIAAIKILLPQTISAETLRSLALFVTFSVNKRNMSLQLRKPTRREARQRSSSNGSSHSPKDDATSNLSNFEIGMEVLRLYSELLCRKDDDTLIKKFAKTVTNKWLLYLLSETSPEVVVLSMRILARLLVVHGDSYVKKFKDTSKTSGFTVMAHRLKRWWHLPALWPALFAVLFNLDVANLDLERNFDLFGFIELFANKKELLVVYPEILEVIMAMLQSGLKSIVSSNRHQTSHSLAPPLEELGGPPERLSMSMMAPPNPLLTIVTSQHVDTFNTVVMFLADLHTRSRKFRDFVVTSTYVQDLLGVLFPVVVGSDTVEAKTELDARDSMLTFDGGDVVVHPLSTAPPVIRMTSTDETPSATTRGKTLRRGSSFVLVSKDHTHQNGATVATSQAASRASSSAAGKMPELHDGHSIVQSLLEIVISVFIDQILVRKEFPGLGLFLKTPPGFVEHQSYFETWILRNTVSQLSNQVALNQKVLTEPRVLTNLARLFGHLEEALFEGWFIGGANPVLDLSGSILEYLQRPDVAKLKPVRLCAQTITIIRAVVFRTVLLSLSSTPDDEAGLFLEKLTYWQTVLLSGEEAQSTQLQLICYLLYADLISSTGSVREAAANLWRIIFVQKPDEAVAIFGQTDNSDQKSLTVGFSKLVELDNETFLYWVDKHRTELDSLFFDTLSKQWTTFVTSENKRTEENGRMRIARRREKVKQWARDEADRSDLIRRHELAFENWTANIYSSEYLKHQRLFQDQQDDLIFTEASFNRMQRDTSRPAGLFASERPRKWRLDQTEGRNRMRMRLHEDFTYTEEDQQPKRKGSDMPQLRLDTRNTKISTAESIGVTPGGITPVIDHPKRVETGVGIEPFPQLEETSEQHVNQEPGSEEKSEAVEGEDSFELVEDPNAELDDFEDKNRKVMRSLHRGDQVKHVANISRILGLEAVEGLLILGKDYIYILDNFFQRADSEIVNVWQAPQEERDPYVRMISGRDVTERKTVSRIDEHGTRSWKWSDIISVSKRRFLFRDVAIEIFFADGRSYLLTVISPQSRNDLHNLISSKTPPPAGLNTHSETAWRYETLRSVDDEPQTLGSKFANVFSQQSNYLAATRKWQKGEMSNFHYLMLINTMAGRTYNDLTQYPVFPWIIADYTSKELDLTDPRTFRDLSKPMGCQTPEREREFKERYQTFAEMGDNNTPAFHYGTHYSSAMIVTSYLIRLQPFVKSYLLLQGGTFDHADRMFYSIEGAWKSASRMNMSDVRELTPEFYYLPEFLVNVNDFDFGIRQTSQSIGSVELPPWAKGDPRIFIAKQREALESPHVSRNLHQWIDLIFGSKQKGEAAVEAVNVFHYLSYQGAKDLDTITDPMERLATIGIIHNFGQTPYQIFAKAHPSREQIRHRYKRLDTAAESLTRLPSTLLETGERVASLRFSWKSDRLLCSGPFRLNIPPDYDMYLEWGFSDNSVRFYSTESRKQIGLFEHLHIGQLSCALFTDSKTLVTAGTDCTVAVWTVVESGKTVELHPRATLFGHRKTVNVLATSRSFNALLSASADGQVMLWDLNRCEFIRKLGDELQVQCAAINDVTGNIVLCHGHEISIYTMNGDLLLRQDSGDRSQDSIVSCACYEGAGNEWLERDLVFTGHKQGQVRVWSKMVRGGRFELKLIRQLNHADSSRDDGANVNAGISCILPMPQVVHTGDEDGRVVSSPLPHDGFLHETD